MISPRFFYFSRLTKNFNPSTLDLRFLGGAILRPKMLKLKAVDFKLFSFPFHVYFSFQIIFLSILRARIRVTRSYSHTSVTSDDIVTSHETHRRI